mmetsp:Transcript_56384/g.63807  ORF Transcript_56384/g.63807 Transcript_56384/m.63807 type:complete len:156 (+) Transcript_56384:342-809(+)
MGILLRLLLLESTIEILVMAQHLVLCIFRTSVHSSIESILLFIRFNGDDTGNSSRPGVRATKYLAKVGMKTSRTPPGKGGKAHTSFHEFGAIDIKKFATDIEMIWVRVCGHQISTSWSRALLCIELRRSDCPYAVEHKEEKSFFTRDKVSSFSSS